MTLGMNARRVFQVANGEEITHLYLIAPDESLIITEGEEVNTNLIKTYYKQTLKHNSGEQILATFNVAIIGPAGVGKSSIVVRYIYNTFSTEYVPTLEDQYSKFERVDDGLYGINVLDTSGTEDFFSLMNVWMLNKDALIMVYSVEDKEHFKGLEKFYQNVKNYDPNNAITKVVIANKVDLRKRIVTKEEGAAFAESIGARYFETSAKNNTNVTEVFVHLIRVMNEKRKIKLAEERKKDPSMHVRGGQEGGKEGEEDWSLSKWIFSKCSLI